jgi:serine/threonine protein kinase
MDWTVAQLWGIDWLVQRGTPAYMAPELMSAKHGPSFAVDVYSFGVVLHTIITGDEPNKRRKLRPLRLGSFPFYTVGGEACLGSCRRLC